MTDQKPAENIRILAASIKNTGSFVVSEFVVKLVLGNFGDTEVTISSILIVTENNAPVRVYSKPYNLKPGETKEISIEEYGSIRRGNYILKVVTTRGTEVSQNITVD
jgi:hypothetical protein